MNEPKKVRVLIIGGGPAGLAAACALWEKGVRDLLILERESQLGGILRQCIHDGFGLGRFGESLSGPEYAQRFIEKVETLGIPYVTDTTVLDISPERVVRAVSRAGVAEYAAEAVILTMGCRERTRGALAIPGERPSGVYTAGVAQAYINLRNLMPGKRVVILGSGDIGMIMARRLTLEGAKVLGVFEILPYPSGLPRNIRQCLEDYDIPLSLSHTVTAIHGHARLTGVTISAVDERMQPIPGTEKEYDCDTLILSVGLIPENELSLSCGVELDARTKGAKVDDFCQTGVPGIFAAGNVLQVHDLVDFVSLEAEHLAEGVTRYLTGGLPAAEIAVEPGDGIGYALPQRISGEGEVSISLRVRAPHKKCRLSLVQDGATLASRRLPKAIPAEMLHIKLPAGALVSKNPLKVVLGDDA